MEDLPVISASPAVARFSVASPGDLPITALPLSNLLAITAIALLVFVSAGVLYLSTVEWRDRRRRNQSVPSRR